MIRPPTGITSFQTSQAQDTIHRPTYSGPSTTTRVVLAGLGGGIQAGTQAYAQAGMMREQWRGMTRATGTHSVEGIARVTSPAEQADVSAQGDVLLNQDQDVVNTAGTLSAAETEVLSDEHTEAELVPRPQPESRPRLQGYLEARLEDKGFELGSGAIERAHPLNGTAYEKDLGVKLFDPGRSSSWLPLGSAEDIRDLPNNLTESRKLAELEHPQFGGSGQTLMHIRNTHTGRQATINVPLDKKYLLSGRDVSPVFISTKTHQSITTDMFRENKHGLMDVCKQLSELTV
ncbi:hypothetical protein N0V94_007122 [Neodidymelliopsis sp. IMI 364377]|nr:hypothetical protein N0V94_007122 [Neodidymelliopsis sp. IMI 364377]